MSELHLALQFIHVLVTEVSSEVVSVERCLSRSHYGRETGERLRYAKLYKNWAENQWKQV